jgi:hypothetical protein
MLKEHAGHVQTNGNYLEHQYCAIARDIHQAIHAASLGKFTASWIDPLLDGLNGVLYRLEQLPEATLIELMEVIEGLRATRKELQLARFLFNVEEIQPLYRLVMRNRAVLRGGQILQKVLRVWPVLS